MTELDATVHRSIREVNRNQWNNLVKQSEHGTAFHRYGWLRAVETGLDRESYHVVVSKGQNPVAILPTIVDTIDVGTLDGTLETAVEQAPVDRLVSVEPGYGGPLIVSNTADCLELLFDTLDEHVERRILSQTLKICDPGQLRYSKHLTGRGLSPSLLSCRFVVDLDAGLERIEEEMDRTRRHGLKKGRESGIETEASAIDEIPLREFYQAYQNNMRRIDGTVYPYSFFSALTEEFPDRVMVMTATMDGEIIGRYLYVLDEEQSTLRYFFSAVGEEAQYEHNVSEVLHTRAMEWGIEQGYSTYDFGATGADFSDGLFKYKEKYGGEVVPIMQWQQGTSTVGWPLYRLGRHVYQKLTY